MVKISPISLYSTKVENLAFLAKLNWRIIKVPDSLWVHGLRKVLNSRRTPFFFHGKWTSLGTIRYCISGPINVSEDSSLVIHVLDGNKQCDCAPSLLSYLDPLLLSF